MTPEKARALFLEHCQPGDRGTLERYGEKAAVAAIMEVCNRAALVCFADDTVEVRTGDYGQGYFATPDCFLPLSDAIDKLLEQHS